jgi:hypothetical protein
MVGEDGYGLNPKGSFPTDHTECFAQQIRMFNQHT